MTKVNMKIIYGTDQYGCLNDYPCSRFDELAPHGYGEAICWITETEDGRMWAMNDEYTSQINFCPFTGQKAKKVI